MRTLREMYVDLINMGSRKRQDLLNKFGEWGSWERVEADVGRKKGSREKYIAQ